MAPEPCNIRTPYRRGLRFGPGWPRDTSPKRRKGLLSALSPKNKHLKCTNPIDTRILPKFRDDRSPVALTIDETQKLLKQIPRANFIGCRDRSAISLMLVHGLRINTVCNIKWSDFEKRGDTYFIHTKSKGNVMTSRPLRTDVASQLLKLYEKTYGVKHEA